MTVDFKKVWKILKAEYQLYYDLYQLAQEKQDVLIAEDLDGLKEIVKKEERLLIDIQRLEEERLQELADHNMDSLLSLVDEPYRQELDDLRNHLVALTVKLKEQNLLNNKLIDDSLTLLNIKLNMFKGNGSTNTYNKEGLLKERSNTFVNRRA